MSSLEARNKDCLGGAVYGLYTIPKCHVHDPAFLVTISYFLPRLVSTWFCISDTFFVPALFILLYLLYLNSTASRTRNQGRSEHNTYKLITMSDE